MTSTSTYSKKEDPQTPPDESKAPPRPQTSQAQLAIQGLPEHQPPLSDKCQLHGQKPAKGQPWVIIHQATLKQIDVHGNSELGSELGGALLGKAYRHQNTVFVEVMAALPAMNQDHGPIHFKFTADSWAQLQRDRQQHYPDLEIVGWFHTHPGLGVFYSGDDVVVHSAAFTLPWHVGLVVDPIQNEASFFGWVNGALAPLSGFYEWLDKEQETVVRWRVVRTAVWDQTYEEYQQSKRARKPPGGVYAAPGNATFGLSSMNPWLGVATGLLGVLLSLFLLIGWVWPLNQQVNRLENVVLMLADEALVDSNAATCPDSRLRILAPLTDHSIPVGTTLTVIGTANHPNAARYRVEIRPAGTETWQLLNERRRGTSLGELATWNTAEFPSGLYEMRLTAVDRNTLLLQNATPCMITIELTP